MVPISKERSWGSSLKYFQKLQWIKTATAFSGDR